MADEPQFQLLLETENPIELASAKSLLASAQIDFVIQGENHHRAAGGLFGNPLIAPRLLVNAAHFARAKELLEARPLCRTRTGRDFALRSL